MKKVLITGFGPFGGATTNPALEAIKKLDGIQINGCIIVTCEVPVSRFDAIDAVIKAIEIHQPVVVITVGQASGRTAITPERIAMNLDDYRIPDNNANQPIDEKIEKDGPDAYFTTLPIKAITRALQDKGIPCQVSNSAGTFVCNHLFYGIQHFLKDKNIPHGFIHIPLLPEQAAGTDLPSMSLETIVEGLKLSAQTSLEYCLEYKEDIKVGAGKIC